MYSYEIIPSLRDKLQKIYRKNEQLYKRILKKIEEVINCCDVESYKNLKYGLKNYKRVHIGPFVLLFRYDKINNIIIFDDFDHHDKVYRR